MKTTENSIINISPSEFLQLSPQPLLIDVRSQLEYVSSHAPTAINLSLPRIMLGKIPWLRNWILPQWFRQLDKNKPVAIICFTAHRSPIVAKELAQSGFTEIYNITGGMREWHKLNFSTIKGNTTILA